MANIAEKFKHFIRNRFYADYAIKHGQVPTETSINKYTERLKHEVDDHYNLWRIQGECLAIEWNQEIEYEYGETCSFLGKNYICILKNINIKPGTDAKYWKPINPEEYTNFYVQRFLPKDNEVPYEPGEIWKEERSIDYHPVTVKFLEERLDWWFKNVTVTNADMLDGFHADFFVSLEVFNNYLETVLLKTDVIDSLSSDEKKKPLSANMGRVLNNEIQLIKGILKSDDLDLDELQEVVDFIKKNKKRLDQLGIDDVDGLRAYLDMLTNNINHLVDIELNNYYDKEQIDNFFKKYIGTSVPAGTIISSASINVPAGYLYCDGQAVSRIEYAKLYEAIGTTFGEGDGSTTFNVPDLRGMFLRGWDNGRHIDSGREFGSRQEDATQKVTGTTRFATDGNNTESVGLKTGTFSGAIYGDGGRPHAFIRDEDGDGGSGPVLSIKRQVNFNFDNSRVARTADEDRPKNIAINYYICTGNWGQM